MLPFVLQTLPALPILERLIRSNDDEVLTDSCWALSYLSDGTNEKIQSVIASGVCGRIIELLAYVSVVCLHDKYLISEFSCYTITLVMYSIQVLRSLSYLILSITVGINLQQ